MTESAMTLADAVGEILKEVRALRKDVAEVRKISQGALTEKRVREILLGAHSELNKMYGGEA